jgi:hypothetical protein
LGNTETFIEEEDVKRHREKTTTYTPRREAWQGSGGLSEQDNLLGQLAELAPSLLSSILPYYRTRRL